MTDRRSSRSTRTSDRPQTQPEHNKPSQSISPNEPSSISSSSRTPSIAPIRSLKSRQATHYPSITEISGKKESVNVQAVPPVASDTISNTIQRLEDLLQEACNIAQMVSAREIQSKVQDKAAASSGKLVKPSPTIRSRAASIIDGPTVPVYAHLPSQAARRRSSRLDSSKLGTHAERSREEDVAVSPVRACNPAHGVTNSSKASIAAPTIASEVDLKPMIPRKRPHSKFVEFIEPVKQPSVIGGDTGRHIKDFAEAAGMSEKVQTEDTVFRRLSHDPEDAELTEGTVHDKVADELVEKAAPQCQHTQKINLKKTRHVDLPDHLDDFDVYESSHHACVARQWPRLRKRCAATVACLNTACIGLSIGIYAGEVPAIQYVIVDMNHYTILGNVFLYGGLAISTLWAWPLPLLHGRKPYTVSATLLALCLQIPQGVAVSQFRSPFAESYRAILLLSRAASGLAFGFINMNNFATLLDVFGASLQSKRELAVFNDPYDVRRQGGGMGSWLGIWSFCSLASISFGFFVGTVIIGPAGNVVWGFWTVLIVLMLVLLLNVIAPEPRRAAFRRTILTIQGLEGNFNRVTRGEVKMHLKGSGPLWWMEEVGAGLELSWRMLKQPGFLVLSVYTAWAYAQFTMVLMVSHSAHVVRY